MRKISNDIKIKDEEYEYKNLNELFDINREINGMRLDIEDPYFSVQFYPDQTWLISEDNNNLILSTVDEIKDILNNHKNWSIWLIKYFFNIILILLIPLAIVVAYLSNYLITLYSSTRYH